MIQLGLPIADAPADDEISAGTSKGMLLLEDFDIFSGNL